MSVLHVMLPVVLYVMLLLLKCGHQCICEDIRVLCNSVQLAFVVLRTIIYSGFSMLDLSCGM
jgi:hypothetical protein